MSGVIHKRIGLAALVVSMVMSMAAAVCASDQMPLRVGFVYNQSRLDEVYSEKDVTLATEVLFGKILGNGGRFKPTFRSFRTESTYVEAIRAGELDYVEMGPLLWLRMSSDIRDTLTPLSVVQTGENRLDRLVMLAAPGASLKSLAGKRLLVTTDSIRDVGQLWLRYELKTARLQAVEEHFGKVAEAAKSDEVLLQAFFGKADVCVVREDDYRLAVELNPQIGERLVPIKRSPAFPLIMTAAAGKNHKFVSESLGSMPSEILDHAGAQQAFDLLKVRGIRAFEDGDLDKLEEIYAAVNGIRKITSVEPALGGGE